MSGIINKVKAAVTGDKSTADHGSSGMCFSSPAIISGPMADHRSPLEYGHTGSGTSHGSGLAGSGTTTTGPHHSNIENKVDPRVDSGM